MREESEFFSEYLVTYIDTCHYIMAQNRMADQRSGTKRSPNPRKRFVSKEKLEEEGNSSTLLSTKNGKELPKRKCPLDCEDAVAYGSLEFFTKFVKKDIVEKKNI